MMSWITKDLLEENPSAPEEFKDRSAFASDGTLDGIRTALFNYRRVSITTCECVDTYDTVWTEKGSGSSVARYLLRAKVNTYTHGEPDDSITSQWSHT